jgi:hypothetical protein
LDREYPKEGRKNIKELDINEEVLEGKLNLSDFNQLTKLNLSNNYLTGIIFPTDTSNLTCLDITNNDFPSQGLSIFSQLTNLEKLIIGTEIKH